MSTDPSLDDRDTILIQCDCTPKSVKYADGVVTRERTGPVVRVGILVPKYMVDTPEKTKDLIWVISRAMTAYEKKRSKLEPPDELTGGGCGG